MKEKVEKYLIRGLACLVALALVVSFGAQFRDSSLKATEADEAASAAPAPAPTTVVETITVTAPAATESAQDAVRVTPEAEEAAPASAPAEEAAPAAEAQPEAPEAEVPEAPAQAEEAAPAEETEVTEAAEAAEEAAEAETAEEAEETEEAEDTEEAEEEASLGVSIEVVVLEGQGRNVGDRIRLIAHVTGAAESEVTYSWQYSLDNANWTKAGSASHYDFTLDETTGAYYWQVVVNRK